MRKLLLSSLITIVISSTLHAQCTSSTRAGVHVVQYGETLFRVSKLYGVTIDNLREWNGMQFNEILSVCQELQILPNTTNAVASPVTETTTYSVPSSQEVFVTRSVPIATTTTYTAPTSTNVSRQSYSSYQIQSGGRHVIAQGETIANIAQLYGYTERRFREFNVLKPGQELTPGSVVLSTDCSCDRVSYSDQSKGLFEGQWNDRLIPHNENAYYHKSYNNNGTVTYNPPQAPTNNSGTYYNNHYTPPSSQGTYNQSNGGYNNNTGTSWGRVNSSPPPPANTNNNGWRRDDNNTSTNRTSPAPYSNNRPATTYMSNEEQAMINEINLVRSNPAGYVTYVEQYIRDIKSGKAFGSSATAAYELIDELKKTAPLSVLQPAECLYQAAKQHGEEAIRKGSSDHQGMDGSWPWDRVKRGCTQMQDGNENLVGGPSNVREAVMLLLVDDGISNRGHRRTLLNKDWQYVACYKSGTIGQMPNNWVQLFGH